MTEVYIPVPDCLLPWDDKLFHIKDENEGQLNENYPMLYTSDPAAITTDAVDPLATDDLFHVNEENQDRLREEIYPVLYTSDPAGISNDVSDPLATDELSDPVRYKCSSVKEDQISDDEEGHVLNECSDGVSSKLMHQDSFDQPNTLIASQGEKVVAQGRGDIVADLDVTLICAKKELSLEENAQPNTLTASQGEKVEVQNRGDKVGDLDATLIEAKKELSPVENAEALEGGAEAEEYDEEESFCLMLESDSDEGDECRNNDAGTKVAQASTSSQGEEMDTEGIGAIGIDLDSMPVSAKKESAKETDATEPISTGNGKLIQNQTMAMESMAEAVDLPAPVRASALLALLEPKIRASHSRKAWKVMDKDIEICGSLLADKITSCSIPGNGQFHSKSRHVSKIRGDRATMTVAGETSGCDNPDTIKFFRVTDSRKSGPKAVMGEKKVISTSMIKNPGKRARSKNNSYNCFNCGDAFNAKHDLIEHLKIHFGSGNLDIDANLTIGKDLSLKNPVSRGGTNISYQTTSFKRLNMLICKRQGARQKGNGLPKENFGATRKKKHVREVRKSFIVDGKSCTDSPHRAKKPYSCNECEKSFSQKSHLVLHIRTHTKEKPYSCGECEKSFSVKSNLVQHIRTHTKEKPYSCGECEKSFSGKSHLNRHVRTHTKEKPYSCGECEKSFSQKSHLVHHMRIHTKEKPYSCGECEKPFSQKGNLINHIRTHTKEKPFSCNECEKSFSVRSNFVRHMRIHTKEKPYS